MKFRCNRSIYCARNPEHTTVVDERRETQWTGRRLAFLIAGASIAVIAATLYFHAPSARDSTNASGDLPTRIGNSEFWSMVTEYSEPEGYFHSDNFLSNEIGFQEVIPDLQRIVTRGGAYLGVGPEQNFTYIASLRPRLAFIIDIRRQNLIEHLLYKSFMEISTDRANFVSMLFARPRPAGLVSGSTADALFKAFDKSTPNSDLFERNLANAMQRLKDKGIPLSFDDQASMRKVYNAFFESGPDLTYAFTGNAQIPGRGLPSYSELMTATDGNGKSWGYLATEDQFEIVRQLELRNLIVPLVGNFAGDKTVRTVGQYIRNHGAIVSTFYLSNVEQYLFQQNDDWSRFYTNVATLPIASTSMIIRSTADRRGPYPGVGRRRWPLRMLTSSIEGLVRDFNAGEIHTYYDVLDRTNTIN
jgi:hypothetical protein